MGHQTLRTKLCIPWQPAEDLLLIDLGSDFFFIKFQKQENMNKVLHNEPWFIFNNFVFVRKWEPKFIASAAQLTYSSIWIRLPELPTEFYDFNILQRVGSKIGTLLKINTCTSATTRGRYARICIEVPLEQPLKIHIFIGMHCQQILHEGLNMFCTLYGRLGHNKALCTFQPPQHTQSTPPGHPHPTTNSTTITHLLNENEDNQKLEKL